ncbi:MAG: glycosyltransferase [Patescibacteria group bacterium]
MTIKDFGGKITKQSIVDKILTVGIPTYVGGESLVRAARSLRASTGIGIFRFIVAVDGNQLKPEIESELKKLGVEVVFASVRGGQVARLKQIIAMCQTELVVLTQDDIIFEPDAISKLVNAFERNQKLTMANANIMPTPAGSTIERIQHSGTRIGKYIAAHWRRGDNYLSANGRCQAFQVAWAKKLDIPEEVINSDAFAYFKNKKLGGTYEYIHDAVVYDKSPLFVAEYVKQNKKFQYSADELARYFGEEIRKEYPPPVALSVKAAFKEGIRHPILFGMYTMLRIYMAFLPNTFYKTKRFWDTDISTKR